MSIPAVLIVEDDRELAELTADWLRSEGMRPLCEHDGSRAVQRILAERPDAVLLDLMLPGEDGFSICRRVRAQYAGPILVLTARRDELDQVLSLELGADDYVAKPASPRVLVARLRALLRRGRSARGDTRLSFGELVIDPGARAATLRGRTVALSTTEFDLLWLLASRAGEVLSRETLVEALRGIEYDVQDRSIDLRISKLRKKIGDDPRSPQRIKTVWGSGYLFVPVLE